MKPSEDPHRLSRLQLLWVCEGCFDSHLSVGSWRLSPREGALLAEGVFLQKGVAVCCLYPELSVANVKRSQMSRDSDIGRRSLGPPFSTEISHR